MKKNIIFLVLICLCSFFGLSSIKAQSCYCKKISNSNVGCQYTTECKKTNSVNCIKQKTNEKCRKKGYVYNKEYDFYSPTGLVYIACGMSAKTCPDQNTKGSGAYDIPVIIPEIISYAVTALKIVTPVILIIMGMIQLIKAITSQNEDEIKKGQSGLIKKLIAAAMIFFVITIVQFVMGYVTISSNEKTSFSNCLSCFLNGTSQCNSVYYRDANQKCHGVTKKK